MVRGKGLIRPLLSCPKEMSISLCKQIATHNLQFILVFTSLRCNSFCTNFNILIWSGRFIFVLLKKKKEKKIVVISRGPHRMQDPGLFATPHPPAILRPAIVHFMFLLSIVKKLMIPLFVSRDCTVSRRTLQVSDWSSLCLIG